MIYFFYGDEEFNISNKIKEFKSKLDKDFVVKEKSKIFLPKRVMSLREAVLGKSEFIPREKAIGRISADTACPCPPGIPVYMPGEIIESYDCLNEFVKVLI